MSAPPVVLDFDGSVGPLPAELRLPFDASWHEAIRFGCAMARIGELRRLLDAALPPPDHHGPVFLGSGDFHHLSWPLIERRIAARRHTAGAALRVVVLDNHPDNMRFPWGVHCGSWVRRVALLPEVEHVHVVGITSGDIGRAHAWENNLQPLLRGKLTYWSTGVDTSWARWLGLGELFRSFENVDVLVDTLCKALGKDRRDTYLSIDKDVLAVDVVQTNWDQGRMRLEHLEQVCLALQGNVVGSDVCGDVSRWRYSTAWKRWLSRADGQDIDVDPARLRTWQVQQWHLNRKLVELLRRCHADHGVMVGRDAPAGRR